MGLEYAACESLSDISLQYHPIPLQVWERMKITVEPTAACAVAAVLSPKFKELAGPDVKRVGVVLCGGNVDLDNLPWMN